MHIPNGFLSDPVCAATTLAATAALGVGFARVRRLDGSRSSLTMAAVGSGIFAAQMVNFSIDHGTSGHVLGAALAAIALGPWCGMLTMFTVLFAQCLLVGDGGWSTLGANTLNMAVVGTLVAAGLYSLVLRYVAGTKGKLLGAGVAAFGSVMASAALCAIELAASGTYSFSHVFTAMMGVHAIIALCEAGITVAVVGAALAIQRDPSALATRGVALAGLAFAIAVAMLLAPMASTAPDGLERVAEDLQFANLATDSWALASDYAAPGIALIGVLAVFVTAYTVGKTATVKVRKH